MESHKCISKTKKIYIKPIVKFSEELLIEEIKMYNLDFPYIAMAQIYEESDYCSSPLFKDNKNLFGMKMASERPTTAIGLNRGHAYYKNWKYSVTDYALLQAAFLRKKSSENDYYLALDSFYAKSGGYANKLRSIVEKHKLKELFE